MPEYSANIPRFRHKFLLKNRVFKADALVGVRPMFINLESRVFARNAPLRRFLDLCQAARVFPTQSSQVYELR